MRDEYAKSALGLWVRARADGIGAVTVEAQERVVVRGGLATGIGADGEVRWEAAVAAAPPAGTWYAIGEVAFGGGWEALEVHTLDWDRLVVGVQRHVVRLIAGGWGDSVAEVVGWFADPLAGASCVAPACYHVMEEYGALRGFGGFVLRPLPVAIDDQGNALFAEMWADVVGVGMPRLEVPRAEFTRSLLIGAIPLIDA